MVTRATSLISKDVLTRDEKKLGQVVNVLIDASTGQSDIVVFPHLAAKLIRDHSGKIAGSIAGQAVSTLKQFIPGAELVDMAMDEVGGYLGGRTTGKVKQIVTAVQESYYLVPVAFVEGDISESVHLNMYQDECRKWFLNVIPSPETHLSFYDESNYEGPDRSAKITLNVPTIEGMVLRDKSGVQTIVKDLAMQVGSDDQPSSGRTVGLVVEDPNAISGSGQLSRLVDLRGLHRHGDQFIVDKVLSEFPVI